MIEVASANLAYKGKWCENCNSDMEVSQISILHKEKFSSHARSFFLCKTCRADLIIKLTKSLDGCDANKRNKKTDVLQQKGYRKKPVLVQAVKYKKGMEDGYICTGNAADCSECVGECDICDLSKPFIGTLEGEHIISKGDYIVTGIKGERYPVKPDIFQLTYEEIKEGD